MEMIEYKRLRPNVRVMCVATMQNFEAVDAFVERFGTTQPVRNFCTTDIRLYDEKCFVVDTDVSEKDYYISIEKEPMMMKASIHTAPSTEAKNILGMSARHVVYTLDWQTVPGTYPHNELWIVSMVTSQALSSLPLDGVPPTIQYVSPGSMVCDKTGRIVGCKDFHLGYVL
jgi:hypothetical protein